MPTQNRPGGRGLAEKTSCLWGWGLWVEGTGRREGSLRVCGTFRPVGSQAATCPRVLGSCADGSTGELGTELMFWLCHVLWGRRINPPVFSK